MAFCAAWIWAGWRSDDYWRAKIAVDDAAREIAYQKEIVRQEEAAMKIAAEATARAEEDAKAQDKMRQIIEEFNNREPIYVEKKVPVNSGYNCHIDAGFSSVVRELDTQVRAGKAPRRPR
jgi:hypothetical protein